ncbi:unnamed protein product [Parnassius mnemosyne]|uniref:Uncharacterized protein n=1 Tax=Parnassius mnemosyne TaxID=213953 RepID=A0AAV1LWU5_9NEOP
MKVTKRRPPVPGGPAIPGYGGDHGNGGAWGANNLRWRFGCHLRRLDLATYNARTIHGMTWDRIALSWIILRCHWTAHEDCQNYLWRFFNQKSQDFYSNGIISLPTRWLQVIEQNGTYIL